MWYNKVHSPNGGSILFQGVTNVCIARINNARPDEPVDESMHIVPGTWSKPVLARGRIVVVTRQHKGVLYAHASLRMRDSLRLGHTNRSDQHYQITMTLEYWSGPKLSPIDSLFVPCLPIVANGQVLRHRDGQDDIESYDPLTVVTSAEMVPIKSCDNPEEFLPGDIFAEYRLN